MLAITVVIAPLSARSTSEQGASIPGEFQSSVAKPPGMAVRSWCDFVMPDAMVELAPSMSTMSTAPMSVFWTLSAIMYIFLPSQLISMRLVPVGPVDHQTGDPSESKIQAPVPLMPLLVTMKPLACAAAFMIVAVGFGTPLGTAPVMIV